MAMVNVYLERVDYKVRIRDDFGFYNALKKNRLAQIHFFGAGFLGCPKK
jgi:hypothetical protein